MQNCSPGIPEGERKQILSKFMNALRISGYTHAYRLELLKGILNRIKEIELEIVAGTRIRYRSRTQIEDQKRSKLGQFAHTWFLTNGNTQILKIPTTPNSKLTNLVRNRLGGKSGADGGTTKLVELAGPTVVSGLSLPDKFGGNKGCQYQKKCMILDNSDCRTAKTVYKIECVTCRDTGGRSSVYLGTSGHTIHNRMLQHAADLRSSHNANALVKHMSSFHPNQQADFETNAVRGGMKFNLNRFILEALLIEGAKGTPNCVVMNSRSEWGHRGIVRLTVAQD